LRQLAALAAEARPSALEQLIAQTIDPATVAERLDDFRTASRLLRLECNLLFFYIFVGGPLLVWVPNFWLYWPHLLVGLLLLNLTVTGEYWFVHRRLYPDERSSRLWHALMMALAPLTSMRALDALAGPLCLDAHPLAVARAIFKPEHFSAFARRVLLDLRYPLPSGEAASPEADEIERWFHATISARLEQIVAAPAIGTPSVDGLNIVELLASPQPEGDDVRAFCPRCRQQFATLSGECDACGGLKLTAFE
jgi:hypothetical protein